MLFQKNIVKKYLAALTKEQTEGTWNQYKSYFLNPEIQANIQQSKEEQFQEGFLRELFVKVLGYTLNPSPDYNLITEKKNETNSKKADGAILLDDKVIGVIELKDHKTTDLSKVEPQAFNYKSQHPDARIVIISNFEKLRLYIDNEIAEKRDRLDAENGNAIKSGVANLFGKGKYAEMEKENKRLKKELPQQKAALQLQYQQALDAERNQHIQQLAAKDEKIDELQSKYKGEVFRHQQDNLKRDSTIHQ